MARLNTKAAQAAEKAAAEKAAKIEQVRATLAKIAKQSTISASMLEIIEKSVTIVTAQDEQCCALYYAIDAANKKNKNYTKFYALCILLNAYAKIKKFSEYRTRNFIIDCEDLFSANQLLQDLFYMGFCDEVGTKAFSEYDNATKTYENHFKVYFTLRYCFGTKAETLEQKGVQVMQPTKEEKQELNDLQSNEIENAYALLTGCGFDADKLLIQK